MRVTFLGQAGVLLEAAGEQLLLDPYLTDNANAPSGGVWARAVPIPVDVLSYRGARAIVTSHEHIDHLDPLTIAPLLACSPQTMLLAPQHALAHLPWLAPSTQLVGMRGEGERYEFGPFLVTSLPAAHSADYRLEYSPEHGHRWCSVVVEAGGQRVFHAGDTVDWEGFAAAVGQVDLACVPINGRGREEQGIVGNLDELEAAALCRAVGARHALALHWDMFTANPGDPVRFAAEFAGTDVAVHAGPAPLSFTID